MPASNPRLTITLRPTIAAQLRRLSELTGNSQASLIAELLDGSEQVFARLITVLEAAQVAKEEMRGAITGDMRSAQERVERQLGLTLDAVDDMVAPLVDAAEAVKRRARKRAASMPARPAAAARGASAGGGSTPVSNRGVRSDPARTKVSKKRGK